MTNQLTQQEIEMANRMAASMLADGVTPEMFMQKAQMEAQQEANKIHMQSQAKREEMAVNGHIKQQERMVQDGQGGGFANPVEAGQGGQGIPPNHPAFLRAQAPGNPQQVGGL